MGLIDLKEDNYTVKMGIRSCDNSKRSVLFPDQNV